MKDRTTAKQIECPAPDDSIVSANHQAIERITNCWKAKPLPAYPSEPSTARPGQKPDNKAPRRRGSDKKLYRLTKAQQQQPETAWIDCAECVGYLVPEEMVVADFDRKHFESDVTCKDAVDQFIAENSLGNTYVSKTMNGGWHVGPFRSEKLPTYENFGIDNLKHCGELRGPGSFVIESGPGYKQVQTGEIVTILEIKGVFPTKQAKSSNTNISKFEPATASELAKAAGRYLPLDILIRRKSKPLLDGQFESDASAELKVFYQECEAYSRLCLSCGVATDNPKEVYLKAVEACNRTNKAEAIIKGIEPEKCRSALERVKGTEYCRQRIEKLLSDKQQLDGRDNEKPEKLTKLEPHKLVDFCLEEFPKLHYNVWSREIVFGDPKYDLDDSDHSDFYLVLATEYGIKASKEAAMDALIFAAKKRRRDPVLDYLENCKESVEPLLDSDWAQIDKLLLGRSSSDPVEAMMIRKFAIGAIARAYQPGCKVDEMIVLCGAQGLKKSSFFRGLGGDFSCDSLGGLDNIKDDMITLHTYWLHEWGELDRITGYKEAGKIKHFCTKEIDSFRPPYGRKNQTFKRRSIIGATVNGDEFLRDPTGNRRFAVIDIDRPIDIEAVKRLRNTFWARAIADYQAGVKWWYEGDEDIALRDKAERFTDTDVWEMRVSLWIRERREETIDNILEQCLGIDIGKQDRSHQIRLSKILKKIGWTKSRVMRNGKRSYLWEKAELPTIKNEPENLEDIPFEEPVLLTSEQVFEKAESYPGDIANKWIDLILESNKKDELDRAIQTIDIGDRQAIKFLVSQHTEAQSKIDNLGFSFVPEIPK